MTDAADVPEPLTPGDFIAAVLSTLEKEESVDGMDA